MYYINWSNFNKVLMLSTNHRDDLNKTIFVEDLTLPSKMSLLHEEQKINIAPFSDLVTSNTFEEHSWQVHIPMITYFKEDIEIYVILVGKYETKLVDSVSSFLQTNKDTLLVCNTDLTHCGPNYRNTCNPNHIQNDKLTIHKLSDLVFENKFKMCGKQAVRTFISVAIK